MMLASRVGVALFANAHDHLAETMMSGATHGH